MKVFVQPSVYIPDPENCKNKWCQSGKGNFPASGEFPEIAACSSYETLTNQQLKSGGVTGRGVTPCPFGYLNRIPEGAPQNVQLLIPFHGKGFDNLAGQSIFFDPSRPTYLPPTGNVRPLARIGNEWKN